MVLDNDPNFLEPLDGFTRFSNYNSKYNKTFPSVAEFLTGIDFIDFGYDVPQKEYLDAAYTYGEFLPDMKERGWDIGLYIAENPDFASAAPLAGFALNMRETELHYDERITMKLMMSLSAYRYSPDVVKPFFWLSTSDFDKTFLPQDNILPYTTNDPFLFQCFSEAGLTAEPTKRFSFFHLNGPHAPYTMDENMQAMPERMTSSLERQTIGSFRIVFYYLDEMRKLGLYDEATIIIMADHGYTQDGLTEMGQNPSVAALFVKPSGSYGAPLNESTVPLDPKNLRATIMTASGGQSTQDGIYGMDCITARDKYASLAVPTEFGETRYYYFYGGRRYDTLLEYSIHGDVNDISSYRFERYLIPPE